MYWLDNNSGISTMPTTPAVVSLTKKFFSNGGVGEPPSIPEDFWFNMVQEELLGVLTLAGITPDKSDLNQVAKAIQSIAFSAYPVGAPIPWPTEVPPAGFIVMSGQSFSATAYPMLASVYPSLVLPDLRGDFIRGWDNGRGVDPGRTLLSFQPATEIGSRIGSSDGIGSVGIFGPDGNATSDPSWGVVPAVSSGALGTQKYKVKPRSTAFNFIVRAK